MKLQGKALDNMTKKQKKKMEETLKVMEETRQESSLRLHDKILQRKASFEEQKETIEKLEIKLLKQVEDVRRRKLILSGALSAINSILEEE